MMDISASDCLILLTLRKARLLEFGPPLFLVDFQFQWTPFSVHIFSHSNFFNFAYKCYDLSYALINWKFYSTVRIPLLVRMFWFQSHSTRSALS